MPRVIRLKEFEPISSITHRPVEWYIAGTDGSLSPDDYRMEIDSNGFITPHAGVSPDVSSIVFLGDSVVEGMFLEPSKRMCSCIQDILLSEYGVRVNVLNAGYSGATLLHSLNVLINKIVPLRPAAVILMTGILDVSVAYLRASFWNKDCWLEPISDLNTTNNSRDSDNRPECLFDDRSRLLKLFLLAAISFGIPVGVATVPHRQVYLGDYVIRKFPNKGDFDRETRDRRAMNAITRSIAIQTETPLFDVELDLIDRTDIFYDMFHHNELGGESVAKSLARLGLGNFIRSLVEFRSKIT